MTETVGWAVFRDARGDLHVAPAFRIDPSPAVGHRLARDCWCVPTPSNRYPLSLDDVAVWVHREARA